jgi:PAS domain S-box-containing protein
MDWIDVLWPLMGGVSLTLGLIHVLIWFRLRNQPALLMFALAAGAIAVLSIFELSLMRAQTPQQYATILRQAQLPVLLVLVSLVGFVLLHFRAGRPWLGFTACALRVGSLLPGLVSGGSLRFHHIEELRQIELWGGAAVMAPVGNASPWLLLAQASELVLVLFLADAIASVWRRTQDRSERRRAMLVCGSMIVFVSIASTLASLVAFGRVHAPLMVNIPFLGVLIVMSLELGGRVARSFWLERRLEESQSTLRGSEQRLRSTAEAVGLGLWIWDTQGSQTWLTEVGSAMIGMPVGERLSRESLLSRIHPEDRAALLQARDDALLHTGKFECEYRLPQPGGGVLWIAASGRVEYDPSGTPRCLRGVIIDISERRHAEELFRVVFENSPAAKLMVDGDGCIVLANIQAARVFGYNRAELLDQHIDRLAPPQLRAEHAHRGVWFMDNAGVRSARVLLGCRKDGSNVPIEVTVSPIVVDGKQFVLASIHDISERVSIQNEVAVQREELTHLSRITLLGEMSGSLAHELNQPLTAVLSNAQAALRFLDEDRPDLHEVHECLAQIVESDKRAGEIIRRLRAMLRKEQVAYEELQVNDVVYDVLRLINSDLLNRNVSVHLKLASPLPSVSGDRVQLQQVLLNLVFNACDAMKQIESGRVLVIQTRSTKDAGVEILVSDVGRGIPPDELERVFAPFMTSKPQGLGLGLAVCRTIIHAHHGALVAINNPVAGATLKILLPARSTGSDEASDQCG